MIELEFRQYLGLLELRHFDPMEFLIAVGRSRDVYVNEFPPRELWPNIVPTAIVLDEIRERIGQPMVISSCYRSEGYNKAVGGVSDSQHIKFKAADVSSPVTMPHMIFRTAKELIGTEFQLPFPLYHGQDTFVFEGGIGLYKNFVHIDTRGYHTTWRG